MSQHDAPPDLRATATSSTLSRNPSLDFGEVRKTPARTDTGLAKLSGLRREPPAPLEPGTVLNHRTLEPHVPLSDLAVSDRGRCGSFYALFRAPDRSGQAPTVRQSRAFLAQHTNDRK